MGPGPPGSARAAPTQSPSGTRLGRPIGLGRRGDSLTQSRPRDPRRPITARLRARRWRDPARFPHLIQPSPRAAPPSPPLLPIAGRRSGPPANRLSLRAASRPRDPLFAQPRLPIRSPQPMRAGESPKRGYWANGARGPGGAVTDSSARQCPAAAPAEGPRPANGSARRRAAAGGSLWGARPQICMADAWHFAYVTQGK
nr:LYR motif-containing protein 9 isoform X2 [Anser cygnoides]